MTAALWGMIAKALFWGLEMFMNKKRQDEEFYKSYIAFLEIADKKGYVKVANLRSGEDALKRLKDRVEKRKEKRDEETKG